MRSHLAHLTLNHLLRPQIAAMAMGVAGGKRLPAEVVEQIVAKTDGVPLFVEELTKALLESTLLREAEDHYTLTGPLPPVHYSGDDPRFPDGAPGSLVHGQSRGTARGRPSAERLPTTCSRRSLPWPRRRYNGP